MSLVLTIDTASPIFAIALSGDGVFAGAATGEEPQDQTRLLVRAIDSLLGKRRRELTGIVVVEGPGSYAGLRVGLATASALALATGARQVGVTVFEALAALALEPGEWSAIQPLGRDQLALQAFRGMEPMGVPHTSHARSVAERHLVGEGARALGGQEVDPKTRCIGALRAGLVKLAAAEAAGETDDPAALYLSEPRITPAKRSPLAPEAPALGA